ncbi:putative ABC exporter domain-containing protein [Clostridium grantii]|uniref:Putative ABC exporter n=1 Tax=Clostridium grantii DSM 8605 TaxID=1121316 RepID=A0A1M5UWI5_9CLOT|nr:putative ABC exporter domain-containing protein [Clostridium grantii]SHH67335.1 Putative ABC exporter [Clostridium grantii DSM 8605]
MGPLFYIMRKSFKNTLLSLKKKPLALIAYILAAVIFIGMVVLSFIMPSNAIANASPEIFGMIITGIIISFTLIAVKTAVKSGGTFFRQSDVNMVFTSPISEKKVLVYGFIKQLYKIVFFLFIIMFQIPNLKNNFSLTNKGIGIILFAMFMYFMTIGVISILIYSFSSKSKKSTNLVNKIILIIWVILAVAFIMEFLKTNDILLSAKIVLNSQFITYLPFFGWIKSLFMYAVGVGNTSILMNGALLILFYGLMVALLIMTNTDYYEDVLQATENYEEAITMKKEGKTMYGTMKNKKLRKVKSNFTFVGAKVIFQRHMLEYRKAGFLFVDIFTLIIVGSSIVFSSFMQIGGMDSVMYFSIYMLLIFSFQGKWIYESSKPYIYLIPATSFNKVFYATLADNIKHLVDGIVLFTLAGIMQKSDLLTIILCILVFTTYGSVFTYGDVLSRRILGGTHSKNLSFFLKFILIIIIIIPGIAVNIAILIIFKELVFVRYLAYLAMIVYNLIVSGILLFASKGIFEDIEME